MKNHPVTSFYISVFHRYLSDSIYLARLYRYNNSREIIMCFALSYLVLFSLLSMNCSDNKLTD